jgi:hypothetical protein
MPGLHNLVLRVPPVAPNLPEAAIVDWNAAFAAGDGDLHWDDPRARSFSGCRMDQTFRHLRPHLPGAGALARRDQLHGRAGLCNTLLRGWTR